MTDKSFKNRALETLDKIKEEIDMAESRLDDVYTLLEINSEVEDFLLDLSADERVPADIQQKANYLFLQV
jgi:hypothetical protein